MIRSFEYEDSSTVFEQLTFIHTVNDSEKDANGVTNTALKQFVSQTSNEGDGLLRSRQ
ncbi:hypothetical protein HORM4_260119 [Vibrio harveyi]|nr:hypothetical protein HORM4_260119 [Vibrio harveyi]